MAKDIRGAKNPNWKGGPVVFNCEQCGKETKQKKASGKKRFCSLKCANKWQSQNPYNTGKRKKRITKKCKQCGGEFKVLPSRVDRYFFCTTDCQFEWRSDQMKGDSNVNWNGGTCLEPYPFVWKDRRLEVIDRDSGGCINPTCRKNTDTINVHHIDYDKDNCAMNNLITLCVSCNARANFKRNYWKKFYRSLLSKLYGYEYGN